MTTIVEGTLLAAVFTMQTVAYISTLISKEDWDRITGPHGVAFIAIVGVIVLWISKTNADNAFRKYMKEREDKEDARRAEEEKSKIERHRELVESNKEYADALKDIALAGQKSAISTRNVLRGLVRELRKRPCQVGLREQYDDDEDEFDDDDQKPGGCGCANN